MPFGIILLILFFICYNFWEVDPIQPKNIVAYEGQNLKYDVTWHQWVGKG
jgi:cbb3-type cytochrome oxidase subunit 3